MVNNQWYSRWEILSIKVTSTIGYRVIYLNAGIAGFVSLRVQRQQTVDAHASMHALGACSERVEHACMTAARHGGLSAACLRLSDLNF